MYWVNKKDMKKLAIKENCENEQNAVEIMETTTNLTNDKRHLNGTLATTELGVTQNGGSYCYDNPICTVSNENLTNESKVNVLPTIYLEEQKEL